MIQYIMWIKQDETRVELFSSSAKIGLDYICTPLWDSNIGRVRGGGEGRGGYVWHVELVICWSDSCLS